MVFGLAGLLWSLRGDRSEKVAGRSGQGVAAPDPAEVERQRLAALAVELELIRALEARSPKAYASLVEKYTEFAGKAAGTEYAAAAREALTAIRSRQEADQSAERLKALEDDFAKLKAFEAANAESYGAIIDGYGRFAEGARGTPFEARAREAADEIRRRRSAHAAELLAELGRHVERHCSAGSFGKALEAIGAFPENLTPAVQDRLAKLREETQTAGAGRARQLLARGRSLSESGEFKEAADAIAAVRTLGLAGQEPAVLAALAEVDRLRAEAGQKAAADARKKYDAYAADFEKLLKAGKLAEARRLGEAAAKDLGGEFGRRAEADASFAAGADDFLTDLRQRLAAQKPGILKVKTPMGVSGTLQRYDRGRDTLEVDLPAGSTTLKLSDLGSKELVQVLSESTGAATLSPEASRRAACYLLACGNAAGVRDLLAAAGRGGLDVSALETRLAVIERGAREVEAEKLLAEFDRGFKASNWAGATSAGTRLLKDFTDTQAVKARADLAALVDQARNQGSPVLEYTLTLQEGLPVPQVGLAAYRGTSNAIIYNIPNDNSHTPVSDGELEVGGALYPLVRFAVTRREGGPLPDDVEILEARLALCKVGGYAPFFELRRLGADWNAKEATASSAATGRTWKIGGGDAEEGVAASFDFEESAARVGKTTRDVWNSTSWWCEFDVTASLKAALKEGRNYGWRVDPFLDKKHTKHSNHSALAGATYDRDPKLRPKLILKVKCRRLKAD